MAKKGNSRRGSPMQMARKAQGRQSASRHLRRAEQAKARLEAKGMNFPDWMK